MSSSTGTWSRTGNPRTALLNLSPLGVTFAPGATRSAGLDGLRVISSGAVAGATVVAAISITDASPLILDTQVDAPTGSLPPPTTAVGVAISSSNGTLTPSNPRVAGLADGLRAQVSAGPATTNSFAISVSNSVAELEFIDLRGGNVNGTTSASAGLFLTAAAGTTLHSSSAWSGIASNGTCVGVAAGGASHGIVLDDIEARGCTGIPGPLAPPTDSVGVSFTTCPPLPPMTAAPRLSNSTVQGGVAQGTNSYVIGVLANDGCALDIESNRVTASNANLIVPVSAAGIICTSELEGGVTAANAPCRIANNSLVVGGRASSASIGIACVGNCATGTAVCRGSCSEVVNNQARGENAPAVFHGFVAQSSPRLARNTFGTDTAQCTAASGVGSGIYGLRVEGSSSRIENNLVLGGQCPTTVGFEQSNVRRTGDGSAPAPDVHSNTIVPNPPAGSSLSMRSTIIGVQVRSAGSVITPFPPLGSYRNNIILALPELAFVGFRAALNEASADSDPAVLENNNFWTGPAPIGMPPLYNNEGTTMLNSAAQINALNGGGVTSNNNMSLDPGFTTNFRLSATSLMRGVGTATGAPTEDIDGQRRPNPPLSVPDVGCDEVQ